MRYSAVSNDEVGVGVGVGVGEGEGDGVGVGPGDGVGLGTGGGAGAGAGAGTGAGVLAIGGLLPPPPHPASKATAAHMLPKRSVRREDRETVVIGWPVLQG